MESPPSSAVATNEAEENNPVGVPEITLPFIVTPGGRDRSNENVRESPSASVQ
jgi:hypothetical protein